jgi:hypothetical protein
MTLGRAEAGGGEGITEFGSSGIVHLV